MRRFWNWEPPAPDIDSPAGSDTSRVLRINGVIAEESWFDDDITPALFASELAAGSGDVTVWINSPGGDVVAAAQIYNMLIDYPGHVKVCIDGIAASAASVIAMAGEVVAMSPVSMLMIHNPATLAVGDADELGRAIDMLAAVKESIINAYELKTGMSRAKLARLMDQETWMDARAAISMGFADDYLTGSRTPPDPDDDDEDEAPEKLAPWPSTSRNPVPLADTASGVCFARKPAEQRLVAHLTGTPPTIPPPTTEPTRPAGRKVVDLYAALISHTH
ncbi:ATP-dependent Clp protease protease subunit [Arcanobacterium wilhelmae]|uniref:ATP-dependent Clp protease proteolytic subunit n=1 Tax=Arcanobacterium wilhelmae TaxID=1803177 RepID=A0ABT9N8T6_9ACTO|nr:head maturation protease, ClpP-related [Arcanobacterium wilhelmae]MDP9800113.1 ATP-dependent Clp protease protease subunit [Arcanobacterium wilhelmae]